MSPDAPPTNDEAVRGRGRVLRGGVATGASTLSFPTIAPASAPAAARAVVPPPQPAEPTEPTGPADDAAAAELERLRLEAAATGYEDGYAAGRDTAIADVRNTAAALLVRLDEAITIQHARQVQALEQIGDDVLGFALATVEALVGHEVASANAPVRDAIQRALRLAPDRLPATVVVHPNDADLAALHDAPGRALTIVADDAIEPGGCIVRVEDCEVDAQIGTALRRLAVVLQHGVER